MRPLRGARATIIAIVAVFLSVAAWQAYWWQTPSGECLPWQNINVHPCQTMEPCPPEFGEGKMCWQGRLAPPASRLRRIAEHYWKARQPAVAIGLPITACTQVEAGRRWLCCNEGFYAEGEICIKEPEQP